MRRWRRERPYPTAGGLPVSTGGGKRGIRHRMVSYPPLNSPSSSFGRDSLRSRVYMRGAHRCVWCSKGTPLMEAELFAAESKRPALDGRALLCAANYAREIQGITASRYLPDARNRAPVTPVSLHISDVSAQKGRFGVSRGARKPFGVLAPFALAGENRRLRRRTAAIPPAGGNRQSPSASADNLSPPKAAIFLRAL